MTDQNHTEISVASGAPDPTGAAHNERVRAIAQNAIDLICLIDLQGNYSYINEAWERNLGYLPQDILGKSCLDLIHPDDRALVTERLMRVMSAPNNTESVIFRFKAKNGEWRFFEARGRNMFHDPRVEAALVNSRDITDFKLAEEQIRTSGKAAGG